MNQSSAMARLSYGSLPLAASPTTDCTCPCIWASNRSTELCDINLQQFWRHSARSRSSWVRHSADAGALTTGRNGGWKTAPEDLPPRQDTRPPRRRVLLPLSWPGLHSTHDARAPRQVNHQVLRPKGREQQVRGDHGGTLMVSPAPARGVTTVLICFGYFLVRPTPPPTRPSLRVHSERP